MFAKAKEAAEFIKSKTNIQPKVGLVLGSGLGVYADQIENKTIIDYGDIPNFHKTSVIGHAGKLILGEVNGVNVVAFQGRFHAYEGHELETYWYGTRM